MPKNLQALDVLLIIALVSSIVGLSLDYVTLHNRLKFIEERLEYIKSNTEGQDVLKLFKLPKEPLNLPMNEIVGGNNTGIRALIIYDCYDCAYHNRISSLSQYFEEYNVEVLNLEYSKSYDVLNAISEKIGCAVRFQNPIIVIWKGNVTFFFERWEPNPWIITCLQYLASSP